MRRYIPQSGELVALGEPFVQGFCYLYRGCMDWEDLRMEAWVALLEACQKYPSFFGCYEFWDYVFIQITKHLDHVKKENNRICRCEARLSLNQLLPNTQTPMLSMFPSGTGNFVNMLTLQDYISRLEMDEQLVCKAYMNNSTDTELMEDYNFQTQELDKIRASLQHKMQDYEILH